MSNDIPNKSFETGRAPTVVVVALIAAAIVLAMQQTKTASNFSQCKDAGGIIMQTFPEQCTVNGKTFTNSAQSGNSNMFLDMTEADALAKAKLNDTLVRVIERDGEHLPATMDFVTGRHSLSVKDGKVYKDNVEK